MSDIRTKLLLGTSIGALAMMFVMAAGVGNFNTSIVDTHSIMGHVTVMAVHPDGSMSYAQADNEILDAGNDLALLRLFDNGAAGDVFDCIRIGNSTAVVTSDVGLTSPLATNSIACDDTGTVSNIVAAPNSAAGGGTVDIIAEFDPLVATDVNTIDGATSITEAILMQNSGAVDGTQANTAILSHVAITAVPVVTGTIVTITYTMELS